MQKTYQNNATDILQFQQDAGRKKIMLLFYTMGAMNYNSKVWTIEITMEAFIAMLAAHKARSFEVEIGYCVTIDHVSL